MRPKWDERRGEQTYGEMTITKALSGIVSVSASQLVLARLSSLKPEAIEWLWPDKIPFGKLSLFVGNPGVGKSFVSIDIAARASRGLNWPDAKNTVEPLETILVSSEDDPNDTILPRFIASGADTSKIHYVKCARETVEGGIEHGFSIDRDLPALQAALKAHPDVRLVIIDPLANHLGDANLNREQEVRRVLTPLANVARDYNVAVIVITHFNKAMSVDTAHKVGGAVAVIGVVRVAWAFVKNPENSEERMMLNMKANISNGARGMSYTVESKEIEDGGKSIRTAVVKWGGATTANLEETMEMSSEDKKSARAAKWLRTFMGDEEQYARDVFKAGDALQFDDQTLRRAFKKLGGKAEQKKDGWVWRLPVEEKPPVDSQPNPPTIAYEEVPC
jgi:putative DNA primase/helicase